MHNYLIDIIETKRESVKKLKESSAAGKTQCDIRSIKKIFSEKQSPVIIAEIKKASPSLGIIRQNFDFNEIFQIYNMNNTVDAVSILTEEKFFCGSLEFIKTAAQFSNKPLLRKDFIIDAKQIYETAGAGADLMLLIAAILTETEYAEFYNLGKSLGLEIITEVHTLQELRMVEKYSPEIIGVNNRNLTTFEVDLLTSENLIKEKRTDAIYISESGIKSADDIKKLSALGFRGFLIGELIMKNQNINEVLNKI